MSTLIANPNLPYYEPDDCPPELENGDLLTRGEFERRYAAMPDVKKAELIEGVVYMGSPVSLRRHGVPHFNINGWLDRYVTETPGVIGGDNGTIRLDNDNEPQPDVFLIIDPECGGQVVIDADDFVVGAPELIVEIASSSASIDLHRKFNSYRRNGVREYVVWRTRDKAIDWFVFREGKFERMEPDSDGIYHSEMFPGLALDAAAMIAGDKRKAARILREAMNRSEHAAFVAKLAEAGAARQ